jgi:hypothetical protein
VSVNIFVLLPFGESFLKSFRGTVDEKISRKKSVIVLNEQNTWILPEESLSFLRRAPSSGPEGPFRNTWVIKIPRTKAPGIKKLKEVD